MVKRHLPLHKTQICLGGKVNTPKNPVESLPRNGKMRAGFAREVKPASQWENAGGFCTRSSPECTGKGKTGKRP